MKKILIAVTLLISSAVLAQTTPEQIFSKGLEYFYAAKFQDAIKYFDDFVASKPNDYKGFNFRGLCYLSLKNYPKAIEDFSTVVNLAKTIDEGYINRANAFFYKGDPSSSLNDFAEAIRVNPKSIEPYLGRGRVYIALNKVSNALTDFNMAASLEPLNARVYVNLAWGYLLTNDTVKAFENVKNALYYDSNLVFTNFRRDLLYLKVENYKIVMNIINNDINNNPNSYLAYFARGFIYFLINDYKKSKSDLVKSLKLNERDDPQFESVVNQLLRNIKRKT